MFFRAVVIGAVGIATAAGVASADTVWDGQTWTAPFGSIAVNGSNLEVTTSGDGAWGAAHMNTTTSFRNSPTQWVQATFHDDGGTGPGGSLWVEDESANHAAWSQLGTYGGDAQYSIYWWNVDSNTDGAINIGARSAGDHTIKIGKRADGTVDYYLDGAFKGHITSAPFDYLGDVYLGAHSTAEGETVVFSDFQLGTDYVAPVPLPGAAVGGLALFALVGVRKWVPWGPKN